MKTQYFNGVSDMVISAIATVVVVGLLYQGMQSLWDDDMQAGFGAMRKRSTKVK